VVFELSHCCCVCLVLRFYIVIVFYALCWPTTYIQSLFYLALYSNIDCMESDDGLVEKPAW
jgi:hypothetical protein